MEAEIIAVGTELLLGDILNTNAQFLSRELAALGITVHFQTVVGDNPARLESVVRQARGRSDLLVFSGGLGPTEDDLTKQTVARAFGDTLRFDEAELEKIRAFFTAWGRTMPENNKKQAMVPTHGRKIPNANGTAPGMIFEDQAAPGKYAVLLPGPPKELQPMFLNSVKPWLAAMSDSVLHSVTLRVTGVGESHLESRIGHLLEKPLDEGILLGLLQLLHSGLELGLVAARIGMVLARKLAERLLYLIGGRRARNAQRFVIIRSCRHTRPPAFPT